jgi:hypothetical protein
MLIPRSELARNPDRIHQLTRRLQPLDAKNGGPTRHKTQHALKKRSNSPF